MNAKKQTFSILLLSMVFLMLILDTKTAFLGAKEGIEICINTVIPSLFPFLVITAILVNRLTGRSVSVLHRFGRFCGIPAGAEFILLIGFVGGYPIGAQCLRSAYDNRQISHYDARRMLGFCNNAGPAFIFGIGNCIFHSKSVPWIIWGIQILSALLVSFILPGKSKEFCNVGVACKLSVSHEVERSMKTMANICSWVIIFRIMIKILQRWILWYFPETAQIAIVGIAELANGCCELAGIQEETLKFLLCSMFMSFGGLCVMMQTVTVVGDLGIGHYALGKLLQTIICLMISVSVVPFFFDENIKFTAFMLVLVISVTILKVSANKYHSRKKVVEIRA